jgi:hypothetical protein
VRGGKMLRRFFLMAAIIAIVTACAASGHAEDWFSTALEVSERWNLGVTCSGVIPVKKDNFNTGINIEGLASYDVIKFLAIGVEGGCTIREIKHGGVNLGTNYEMPILGDIIVKAPLEIGEVAVTPYGIAGFGALFSWISKSGSVTSNEMKTDTPFLMKFGGGVDCYLFEGENITVAVNCEASYQIAEIKLTGDINGTTLSSQKVTADACYIGGGLKIKF